MRGRYGIRGVYAYWLEAFPDMVFEWPEPIIDGDRAALFWHFSGTLAGEFFGHSSPGTRVEFDGAGEYDMSPAGIVRARHIFDFTGALLSAGVLKDSDLLATTGLAAGHERDATARLVGLLAEVDTRRLYLGEGYSSMFAWCTRALQMSEHAAYARIEAARMARRYPEILERLSDGRLSLTTVGLLAPHLTDENCEALFEAAERKSKREVERLIAGLHSQPDIPASVRALPDRTAAVTPTLELAMPADRGPSLPIVNPPTEVRELVPATSLVVARGRRATGPAPLSHARHDWRGHTAQAGTRPRSAEARDT